MTNHWYGPKLNSLVMGLNSTFTSKGIRQQPEETSPV